MVKKRKIKGAQEDLQRDEKLARERNSQGFNWLKKSFEKYLK